jgi:hypothetical protein
MVYEATDGRLKIQIYVNAILYAPRGIRGSNYRAMECVMMSNYFIKGGSR